MQRSNAGILFREFLKIFRSKIQMTWIFVEALLVRKGVLKRSFDS